MINMPRTGLERDTLALANHFYTITDALRSGSTEYVNWAVDNMRRVGLSFISSVFACQLPWPEKKYGLVMVQQMLNAQNAFIEHDQPYLALSDEEIAQYTSQAPITVESIQPHPLRLVYRPQASQE